MVLIAFDPDYERSGYAVFEGDVLREVGSVRLSQVRELLERCGNNEIEVVIENQYIPRELKNPQAVIKLAHIAGAIWGICRYCGIDNVKWVEPLAWMQWVMGSLRGLTAKERQERIKERAEQESQLRDIGIPRNDEERAAICIGLYWVLGKRVVSSKLPRKSASFKK